MMYAIPGWRAAAAVGLMTFAVAMAADRDAAPPRDDAFTADYHRAAREVAQRARDVRRARARNVILFVGDGMSITTITAARIFEGQRKGGPGEDNRLSFEELGYSALVRTYSANQQTSDSAPTATAMMTGYKANDGAISVHPSVRQGESDEAVVARGALHTVLEEAEDRGLSTGIVTTTRVTHATPATTYAHTPNRDWEYDLPLASRGTLKDIAAQLVQRQKTGNGIEVVFGGGRQVMLPKTMADPEYPSANGLRNDGRNLVEEWVAAQPGSTFVWNRAGFDALDPARVRGPVLGLFEPAHMRYEIDRDRDAAGEPSLAEMTRKAIGILSRNRKGYFLLVEGGRIDHAHHSGNAHRALADTVALSDAVRAATELTSPADTLILVTADHSHTMTMAGYPGRGNPILGLVKPPDAQDYTRDIDGRPYATLSYANGPGFAFVEDGAAGRRAPPAPGRNQDLSQVDTTDEGFFQESLVGLPGETHGGEDVALFARGPGAPLVRGVIDQNEIYHIMRRALGY
jgi:alkaline phosphatase